MKKYEFTKETKIYLGKKFHRIRAVIDFGDVKAGDIGGWIENKRNLSHSGECWIYNEAVVMDNAKVRGNAIITDEALICNNAIVEGNVAIRDNAVISNNALICGNACIGDKVRISNNAQISDYAEIYDNAYVYGDAKVSDHAMVYGSARICDQAQVDNYAIVHENVWVMGDARICSFGYINGNARVGGNALIRDGNKDVFWISKIGSRNDTVTFMRTENNEIFVKTGCFGGMIDEFVKAVEETHGDNKHAKAYKLAVELAKLQLN